MFCFITHVCSVGVRVGESVYVCIGMSVLLIRTVCVCMCVIWIYNGWRRGGRNKLSFFSQKKRYLLKPGTSLNWMVIMINNDNNIYNTKYTRSHFMHSVSRLSGKQHWYLQCFFP